MPIQVTIRLLHEIYYFVLGVRLGVMTKMWL